MDDTAASPCTTSSSSFDITASPPSEGLTSPQPATENQIPEPSPTPSSGSSAPTGGRRGLSSGDMQEGEGDLAPPGASPACEGSPSVARSYHVTVGPVETDTTGVWSCSARWEGLEWDAEEPITLNVLGNFR